jgi:uncharacterized protein (DUF488 family)
MIYTNNFFSAVGTINQASIANTAPKGWVGPTLRELAPGGIVWQLQKGKITESEYTEAYMKQLKTLDEKGYNWQQLDGKTLLCWEAAGKFCHRKLLGEFLQSKGFQVDIR